MGAINISIPTKDCPHYIHTFFYDFEYILYNARSNNHFLTSLFLYTYVINNSTNEAALFKIYFFTFGSSTKLYFIELY